MTMTAEQVREHMDEATRAYQAQEWSRAADMFTELLLEPEALSGANEMHWNIAMCMAQMGNFPLALEHVRAGGYDEQEFRRVMAESNVRDATHDFQQAVQLYEQQQWQQACDAFAELLLHPGLPGDQIRTMHWNMGMCFARMGNFSLGLEHVRAGGHDEQEFRRVLAEANVRDAQHDFDQAVQLYQQQQWSQAADAFVELLLHPGYAAEQMGTMHWNVAMCFAHLGNWDLALEHVRAGGQSEEEFQRNCEQHGLARPAVS